MRLRHAWLAPALMGLFASVGYAQTQAPNAGSQAPDFTVQVWGQAVADFNSRVAGYVELRSTLEREVPAQTVTDDPVQLRSREVALARKIRLARRGVKQGAIFTRTISVEFRKALLLEMANSNTRDTLREDNPGAFPHSINGTYPKNKPFSTVPIDILAALPKLPDDIEYRFLGSYLVLHDTRANMIVDRIPCAVPGYARVGCHR